MKRIAVSMLMTWSLLFAPFQNRAKADHPVVMVFGAVVIVGIVTTGSVVAWTGGKGSFKVDHETKPDGSTTTTGTFEVDATGGDDEKDGGGGGGGVQGAGGQPAFFSIPDDMPGLQLPPGHVASETIAAQYLPGGELQVGFHDLHHEADVLYPGYGPNNLAYYDVTREMTTSFERPAGPVGDQPSTLRMPLSFSDMTLSTTQIPDTFGVSELHIVVDSPQLGVLFASDVYVPQEGAAVVTGDIPAQAFQFSPGIAKIAGYQTMVEMDVPPGIDKVDISIRFQTKGRGVKEEGVSELSWEGGIPGSEPLNYKVVGDPGELFVLIPSVSGNQTPLAIFDQLDPRSLDVGLELMSHSKSGIIPPGGEAVVSYPLPNLPGLAGLELNAQVLTLAASSSGIMEVILVVDNLSNRTTTVLGPQGYQHPTLGGQEQDRSQHAAVTMSDGRVLLTGGLRQDGSGVVQFAAYDPQSSSLEPLGKGLIAGPRAGHEAVLLDDGRVFLFGGRRPQGSPVLETELIRVLPSGELVSELGPALPSPRHLGRATKLADGRILLTGGSTHPIAGDDEASFAAATSEALIFDPLMGYWVSAGRMPLPLLGHGQSLLGDGTVLVTGGIAPGLFGFAAQSKAWIYDPAQDMWVSMPPMPGPRALHSQVAAENGGAFIAGGGTVVPAGGWNYKLIGLASTLIFDVAGDAGPGFALGAALPDGLDEWEWTICCVPSFGPNGYCCWPCLAKKGEGPIILDPGEGSGAPGAEAQIVVKFGNDGYEAKGVALTLFPHGGGSMTMLPGEGRALISGGAAGPTPSEVIVVGDASEL